MSHERTNSRSLGVGARVALARKEFRMCSRAVYELVHINFFLVIKARRGEEKKKFVRVNIEENFIYYTTIWHDEGLRLSKAKCVCAASTAIK